MLVLQHELYEAECGADNPLRCDVGDLTARLGTLSNFTLQLLYT